MIKRNRLLLLGGAALALAFAAVLLVPACRWRVVGWARSEAFYRGRPTSYWRAEIESSWHTSCLVTPGPWSLPRLGFLDRLLQRPFRGGAPDVLQLDAKAVPVLVELLLDSDPDMRRETMEGLIRIGPKHEGVLPPLLDELFQDTDPINRFLAARGLRAFGPEDRVVTSLTKVLGHDQDPKPRRAAAEVLGDFGPEARFAVPQLVRALSDDDRKVRETAAGALKHIEPQTAAAAGVK